MSIEPDNQPLFEAADDFSKNTIDQDFPPDYEEPAATSSSAFIPTSSASNNVSGRISTPSAAQSSSGGGIFTFGHYAHYFDVDTRDVAERALLSLNPVGKSPFLLDDDLENGVSGRVAGGSNGQPDLWGPFWICTTVVVVLFFASTLVGLLVSSWNGVKYEYKFELLSGAAGLMYSYTFVLPLALWLVLRYLNIAPTTTLLQLVALYGYANVPWIPVAILSVSPLFAMPRVANVMRWIFIAFGYAFSGAFIAKSIYIKLLPEHNPSADTRQKALIICGVVVVLHTALAFAVKLLFFGGLAVEKS